MSDQTARVHWSFWLIGGIGLIWNVLGSVNFLVQLNPDAIVNYREVERAIIDGRPIWATAGFAVAVFGGAIGALLLLLKKSAATYVFVASFFGVALTVIHAFIAAGSIIAPAEVVVIIVMPMAVALFLVWYAKQAERKGWIA